jgi:adenylate cyclase
MGESSANRAWIEWDGGEPLPLQQTCSIGRASANQLRLPSESVSRRHAVISEEGPDEFHILDLGSSNGTLLNGRRVTRSTPLKDGDAIEIGPFRILFRQRTPNESAGRRRPPPATRSHNQTVRLIKGAEYWLVLADIASSTALSGRLSPDELRAVIGGWFDRCREIIDRHGGAIDNCLGDGFLAYWHPSAGAGGHVADALAELKTLRDGSELPFRLAVHYGDVFAGGAVASGVERFFGPQVNFVFKLERLASALGEPGLLSTAAHERLEGKLDASAIGEHELIGFPGTFTFYRF